MEKFVAWIDDRFPMTKVWEEHMAKYYAPKNFNFWYYFGSLAILMLVMQIATGIFLTMHYKPDTELAFASVEYIMRDVFRGIIYGSYRGPRELVWIFGMVIFVALMAESFMGYLLPWGNMSFWGAQVIISLFGAIPYIGDGLVEWLRGDFVISDATLNRFFAFHVAAVPLALVMLVYLHIVALHKVGSNNPDGIEIKENKDENGIPKDGIPFHPYYTVKDIVGVIVFLMVFSAIIFFMPELGGWFLEKDNFTPADPLTTPSHIVPLWYFTPYYSILRAVTWEWLPGGAKLWGVIAMGGSLVILFFLPWLDKSSVKSIRYRGSLYKVALAIFLVAFIMLGWLGTQPAEGINTLLAQIGLFIYFGFFLLMPIYTKLDKTKPVPERLT
jgi:ubiquinol-cytochrome c reductase cytochrome b subunit